MSRVIIDSDVPYIRGVLEPYFDLVEYVGGREITGERLKDVQCLITRTRTLCNKELLQQAKKLEIVATATIGTDHIDMEYCVQRGIEVVSAAGCNSRAVASWVFSVMAEFVKRGVLCQGYRLGVIGVGSVGTEVASIAQQMGVELMLCDPPKRIGVGLSEVLRGCDVITLHVPLDSTTYLMIGESELSVMRRGSVVLNSSRGEVIDQGAVVCSEGLHYALDVWCNEPYVDKGLLDRVDIATPHIAGYSSRGKARATTMVVQALAKHFCISELYDWDCSVQYALEEPFGVDIMGYDSALRLTPDAFEALRVIRA